MQYWDYVSSTIFVQEKPLAKEILTLLSIKVEKILEGSLDSISSPSTLVKIMGWKICLRYKGKTLLGLVNKLFVFKSLLTMPSNVLLSHMRQTLLPIMKLKVMGWNPDYLLKNFLLCFYRQNYHLLSWIQKVWQLLLPFYICEMVLLK